MRRLTSISSIVRLLLGAGLGIAANVLPAAAADVAPGPGYFIDSVNGRDTDAGTVDHPWKTLRRAALAKLVSGQGIYLRCGSLWRESLSLDYHQLVDGSVLASYGDCPAGTSKPTISGADLFAGGWTKNGAIWSRSVPAGTPKINRLFVNGIAMRTAQWPNYVSRNNEYAIAASSSPSSNTILQVSSTDLPVLTSKDLVGAAIQVRTGPWLVEQQTVKNYDAASGMITLTAATHYSIKAGGGYILQDKLWMLDAPGEFYHDQANNVLYLVPPSNLATTDLNTARVEGSVRDVALSIKQRSNLVLRDFQVEKARAIGLAVEDAPGTIIHAVYGMNNGESGLRIVRRAAVAPSIVKSAIVRYSAFGDNWASGINANYAPNAEFFGNAIYDTGTIAYAGFYASYATAGPMVGGLLAGDGANVHNNMISRSALSAIRFSATGGTQVVNNFVEDFCLRFVDCGGIYTWNGFNSPNQSSTIQGNIVSAVRTGLDTQGAVGAATDLVAGIYLDDFSTNSHVSGNVVINAPFGIFVHNGMKNTVENNRLWLNTKAALWANMDHTDGDYMYGNTFRSNQLVPAHFFTGTYPAVPQTTAALSVMFWDKVSAGSSLNNSNLFTGNRIVQLNGDSTAEAQIKGSSSVEYFSARDWIGLNPGEALPAAPATYGLYAATLGAELISNGNFDLGIPPWSYYRYPSGTGGQLTWTTNMSGCVKGCAAMTAGSIYDSFYSPAFSMNADKLHLLSFSAAFGGSAALWRPGITRNVSPYDSFVGTDGISSSTILKGTAGGVSRYEGFFKSTNNSPARVSFGLSTLSAPVGFDSVSLREVSNYSLSKPADWAVAAYASPHAAKVVDCSTLGWPAGCSAMDVDGNAVSFPVSLPAGTAKLFLRLDTSWKR